MKALLYERKFLRYGAAVAGARLLGSGRGVPVSPLRLADIAEADLPGEGWVRVRPLLAGICGSDLATLDGRASRALEAYVSFPFVPGHEMVGVRDDTGARVVLEPVLGCTPRGIEPCPACATGAHDRCGHLAFGALGAGLQTGYCADVPGAWAEATVAHESQLHDVPGELSDEEAVMVEPTACALHAAAKAPLGDGSTVALIGAGTLGLCVLAALRHGRVPPRGPGRAPTIIVAAKHPVQRRLAEDLGADSVVAPGALRRAVRLAGASLRLGDALSGGADVTFDCAGSADSLAEAMAITRPGGAIVLVGMPGAARLDLAPLWQRQLHLVGAYTYGVEQVDGGTVPTFELALELVRTARLGRLVSQRYPLERAADALRHAGEAGARGAIKVVFEPGGRPRRGGDGPAAAGGAAAR